MSKIKAETNIGVDMLVEHGDIAGYAAHAAALVLAGNWTDAMRDGAALPDLLNDVDDVIERLRDWRATLVS